MHTTALRSLSMTLLALLPAFAAGTETGVWKTAFFKRGSLGLYDADWAGLKTADEVLRTPVPLAFDGTQVRAWARCDRNQDIVLARLSLAPGTDRAGGTEGRFYPITFSGTRGVTLAAKGTDVVSDASPAPVKAGLWYLQQAYAGPKFHYVYDTDGLHRAASEAAPAVAADAYRKGSIAGNVYRIDVLTADIRPVVVCYGDSITQGHSSTPGAGHRYPDLLAQELDRPVLNLGVNGDLAKYARGMPALVAGFEGVDTVVFLMGINDIISGTLTSADDYIKNLTNVAATVRKGGRKFYLGTITPAGGYAKFDADPAKETLRQTLNTWIRTGGVADGVIDFDAALRDETNPVRLRSAYQADWLHPNDAGYEAMAKVAARALR